MEEQKIQMMKNLKEIHPNLNSNKELLIGGQIYLNILQQFIFQRIFPNFYCSLEYFEKANWKVKSDGGHNIQIVDSDDAPMLPAISLKEGKCNINLDKEYMAGFSGLTSRGKFHDYEFIYDPKEFLSIEGGRWKMTRKNIRWAKLDIGKSLYVSENPGNFDEKDIQNFLEKWGEKYENIYDPETLIKYILSGNNRIFFSGEKNKELFGIIAYDGNFNYINFRYCIVKEGIRGLSDLMRVLFYQMISACYRNKLVNDGGSLDSDTLHKYKARLNPCQINKIWSTLK